MFFIQRELTSGQFFENSALSVGPIKKFESLPRYPAESFLGASGHVDPAVCGIPLDRQVTKYVSTAAGQAVMSAYVARDMSQALVRQPQLGKVDQFLRRCRGQAYQSVGSLLGIEGWHRFPKPQHTEELLWRIALRRTRDGSGNDLISNLPSMASPEIAEVDRFMEIWLHTRGPDSDNIQQLLEGFDNVWGLKQYKFPLMNVDKTWLHAKIYGERASRGQDFADMGPNTKIVLRAMTRADIVRGLNAVTTPDGIGCEGRLTTFIARTDEYIAKKERLR